MVLLSASANRGSVFKHTPYFSLFYRLFSLNSSDNYMGKSELYLEYFLGILAYLPQINPEQHHKIIATCNDTKRHEPIIKKLAQGTHQVELRGIPTTINIEIVDVLPEGIAAIRNHKLKGNVTICDIGGGNVTITRYCGWRISQ